MTSKALTGIGRSNLNFVGGYINGSNNRRSIRIANTSTSGVTANAMRGITASSVFTLSGVGTPTGVAVSRSGGIASASHPIIALVGSTTPRLQVVSYPGGTSTTAYTLGTAMPSSSPSDVDITDPPTYTTDPRYIAVAIGVSPWIVVYKVTQGSSTITKLTDPATIPTGIAYGCAWNPAGTVLAVRHATSPFLSVYTRSGDTLTKVANPATLPVAPLIGSQITAKGVTWNASGDRLMITGTTNTTQVYSWDGTTLIRVYSSTTGTFESVAFHPILDDVLAGMNASGNLIISYFNKTTNTLSVTGTSINNSSGRDIKWSQDGTIITHLINTSGAALDYSFRYQSGLTTTTALTSRANAFSGLTDGCWLQY